MKIDVDNRIAVAILIVLIVILVVALSGGVRMSPWSAFLGGGGAGHEIGSLFCGVDGCDVNDNDQIDNADYADDAGNADYAVDANMLDGIDSTGFCKSDGAGCSLTNVESGHNDCYWTGYQNGFDAVVNFKCNAGFFVAGVYSYHSNHNEDRRFNYYCCKPV